MCILPAAAGPSLPEEGEDVAGGADGPNSPGCRSGACRTCLGAGRVGGVGGEAVTLCAIGGMWALESAAGAAGADMGCLVVDGLSLVGVEVPVKDGVEGGMGKEGVADMGGRMADKFGSCNSG